MTKVFSHFGAIFFVKKPARAPIKVRNRLAFDSMHFSVIFTTQFLKKCATSTCELNESASDMSSIAPLDYWLAGLPAFIP